MTFVSIFILVLHVSLRSITLHLLHSWDILDCIRSASLLVCPSACNLLLYSKDRSSSTLESFSTLESKIRPEFFSFSVLVIVFCSILFLCHFFTLSVDI